MVVPIIPPVDLSIYLFLKFNLQITCKEFVRVVELEMTLSRIRLFFVSTILDALYSVFA